MKGAMILMLLLWYPVLVTARVSTRTTNRRSSRARNELLMVTVKTSTQEYADTDDAVYLQLFGGCDSPYFRLDTLADDFQRGSVDMFNLSTPYVADIPYIKLKIGDDDGWFVDNVTLEWASRDQAPMVFNFSFWLDDARHLFAYSPYKNPARYRVTVTTGHFTNCGTDEMITITLYSEKYKTLPYILDNDNYDDFERRSEDVFDLTTDDIGSITAVSFTVDGGDTWLLEWVSVVYVKTGHKYLELFYKWYHV